MTRFTPTEEEMRRSVLDANERANRLAARVGNARRALLRGDHPEIVLALLDDTSQAKRSYGSATGTDGNAQQDGAS